MSSLDCLCGEPQTPLGWGWAHRRARRAVYSRLTWQRIYDSGTLPHCSVALFLWPFLRILPDKLVTAKYSAFLSSVCCVSKPSNLRRLWPLNQSSAGRSGSPTGGWWLRWGSLFGNLAPNLRVCCDSREMLSDLTWSMGHPAPAFPGGSDGKESACNAGDLGSIPGLGRSPEGGHGNPLQHSCLENALDRGVWWAIVHRVSKS